MNESRILGEQIELNANEVKIFFDERCKKQLPHLYNYTNYQDKHPDLVLKRDLYEKEKICPLLSIKYDTRVLDIGCGVGRWASTIVSQGGTYVGVDYSESLLELAKQGCEREGVPIGRYEFICADFQHIINLLPERHIKDKFDVILINGVLMYINDKDLLNCIGNVGALLKENGLFYVKESIACGKRLTLKHVYSDELSSYYSAIYRSAAEYEMLLNQMGDFYEMIQKGEMWEVELKNRKETSVYYWVMRKCGG